MTPKEARECYEAEWPALNAAKEEASARGDAKAAKKARQQLSALSQRYAARHEPPPREPSAMEDLQRRVAELERGVQDLWRFSGREDHSHD